MEQFFAGRGFPDAERAYGAVLRCLRGDGQSPTLRIVPYCIGVTRGFSSNGDRQGEHETGRSQYANQSDQSDQEFFFHQSHSEYSPRILRTRPAHVKARAIQTHPVRRETANIRGF